MKMIAAMILAATAAGASTAGADPGRRSMKGWELYTWRASDHAWRAALVVGTNREKSFGEIERAAVPWRELAPALDRLAAGEEVAWMRTPHVFEPPGAALRDPIVARAKHDRLALDVR
jgi:hypothetical protein